MPVPRKVSLLLLSEIGNQAGTQLFGNYNAYRFVEQHLVKIEIRGKVPHVEKRPGGNPEVAGEIPLISRTEEKGGVETVYTRVFVIGKEFLKASGEIGNMLSGNVIDGEYIWKNADHIAEKAERHEGRQPIRGPDRSDVSLSQSHFLIDVVLQ
jgi:hypothetical protein